MKPSLHAIMWFVLAALFAVILWKWRTYKSMCSNREPFANIWDARSKELLEKTLFDMKKVFSELNVAWFAAFGTLLGAIRHNDVIPWDDDADVFVDRRLVEQSDIFDLFIQKMTSRGYVVSEGNAFVPYKIYPFKKAAGWPFVDIFLFDSTEDRIVFDDTTRGEKTTYSKSEIFPVKYAIFGNVGGGIPIPQNSDLVLTRTFGPGYMTECISSGYNHREEVRNDKVYKESCSVVMQPNVELKDIPAYVINLDRRRDRWNRTCEELRRVGLEATRISAIDAKSSDFQKLYASLPNPKRTGPEVACAASHIKAMKAFLKSSAEYGLIFEDDIAIPSNVSYETLNTAFKRAKGMKLLLLGHCYSSDKRCVTPGTSLISTGLCLHAYVISRRGAEDIINTYTIDRPIDTVTELLCERTGGLCYIAGGNSGAVEFGEGLIFQLSSEVINTDIPKRGIVS